MGGHKRLLERKNFSSDGDYKHYLSRLASAMAEKRKREQKENNNEGTTKRTKNKEEEDDDEDLESLINGLLSDGDEEEGEGANDVTGDITEVVMGEEDEEEEGGESNEEDEDLLSSSSEEEEEEKNRRNQNKRLILLSNEGTERRTRRRERFEEYTKEDEKLLKNDRKAKGKTSERQSLVSQWESKLKTLRVYSEKRSPGEDAPKENSLFPLTYTKLKGDVVEIVDPEEIDVQDINTDSSRFKRQKQRMLYYFDVQKRLKELSLESQKKNVKMPNRWSIPQGNSTREVRVDVVRREIERDNNSNAKVTDMVDKSAELGANFANTVPEFYRQRIEFLLLGIRQDSSRTRVSLLQVPPSEVSEETRDKTWEFLRKAVRAHKRATEAAAVGGGGDREGEGGKEGKMDPAEVYDQRIDLWLMVLDAHESFGDVFGTKVSRVQSSLSVDPSLRKSEGLRGVWSERCQASLEAWNRLFEASMSSRKPFAYELPSETIQKNLMKLGLMRNMGESVGQPLGSGGSSGNKSKGKEGGESKGTPALFYVRPFGLIERHFSGGELKGKIEEAIKNENKKGKEEEEDDDEEEDEVYKVNETLDPIIEREYENNPRLWRHVVEMATRFGVLPDPESINKRVWTVGLQAALTEVLKLASHSMRIYNSRVYGKNKKRYNPEGGETPKEFSGFTGLDKNLKGNSGTSSMRFVSRPTDVHYMVPLQFSNKPQLTKAENIVKREVMMNALFGQLFDLDTKRWINVEEVEKKEWGQKGYKGTLFERYASVHSLWLPSLASGVRDTESTVAKANDIFEEETVADNYLLAHSQSSSMYQSGAAEEPSEENGGGGGGGEARPSLTLRPSTVYSENPKLVTDDIKIVNRRTNNKIAVAKAYELANNDVREGLLGYMFGYTLSLSFTKLSHFLEEWLGTDWQPNAEEAEDHPEELLINELVQYVLENACLPIDEVGWLLLASKPLSNDDDEDEEENARPTFASHVVKIDEKKGRIWVRNTDYLFQQAHRLVFPDEVWLILSQELSKRYQITLKSLGRQVNLDTKTLSTKVHGFNDRLARALGLYNMGYSNEIFTLVSDLDTIEIMRSRVIVVEYFKSLRMETVRGVRELLKFLAPALRKQQKETLAVVNDITEKEIFKGYVSQLSNCLRNPNKLKALVDRLLLAQSSPSPSTEDAKKTETNVVKAIAEELARFATDRENALGIDRHSLSLFDRFLTQSEAETVEQTAKTRAAEYEPFLDDDVIHAVYSDTSVMLNNNNVMLEERYVPTFEAVSTLDAKEQQKIESGRYVHGSLRQMVRVYHLALFFLRYGTYPVDETKKFALDTLSATVVYLRLVQYFKYLHPNLYASGVDDEKLLEASIDPNHDLFFSKRFAELRQLFVDESDLEARDDDEEEMEVETEAVRDKETLLSDKFKRYYSFNPAVRLFSNLWIMMKEYLPNPLRLTTLDLRVLGALLLSRDYSKSGFVSLQYDPHKRQRSAFEELKKLLSISQSPDGKALVPDVGGVITKEEAMREYAENYYEKGDKKGRLVNLVSVGKPLQLLDGIVKSMHDDRVLFAPEQLTMDLQVLTMIRYASDPERFSLENRKVLVNDVVLPVLMGLLANQFDLYLEGIHLFRDEEEEDQNGSSDPFLAKDKEREEKKAKNKKKKKNNNNGNKPPKVKKEPPSEAEQNLAMEQKLKTSLQVGLKAKKMRGNDLLYNLEEFLKSVLDNTLLQSTLGAYKRDEKNSAAKVRIQNTDPDERFGRFFLALQNDNGKALATQTLHSLVKPSLPGEDQDSHKSKTAMKNMAVLLRQGVVSTDADSRLEVYSNVLGVVKDDLESFSKGAKKDKNKEVENDRDLAKLIFARACFWLQVISSSLNVRVYASFLQKGKLAKTNSEFLYPARGFKGQGGRLVKSEDDQLSTVYMEKRGMTFTFDSEIWPKEGSPQAERAETSTFGLVLSDKGEAWLLEDNPPDYTWRSHFLSVPVKSKPSKSTTTTTTTTNANDSSSTSTSGNTPLSSPRSERSGSPPDVEMKDAGEEGEEGEEEEEGGGMLSLLNANPVSDRTKELLKLFETLAKRTSVKQVEKAQKWFEGWNKELPIRSVSEIVVDPSAKKVSGKPRLNVDGGAKVLASVLKNKKVLEKLPQDEKPIPGFVNTKVLTTLDLVGRTIGASSNDKVRSIDRMTWIKISQTIKTAEAEGQYLLIPFQRLGDAFAFVGRLFGVPIDLIQLSFLVYSLYTFGLQIEESVLTDLILYYLVYAGSKKADQPDLLDPTVDPLVARELVAAEDPSLANRVASYAQMIATNELANPILDVLKNTNDFRRNFVEAELLESNGRVFKLSNKVSA